MTTNAMIIQFNNHLKLPLQAAELKLKLC